MNYLASPPVPHKHATFYRAKYDSISIIRKDRLETMHTAGTILLLSLTQRIVLYDTVGGSSGHQGTIKEVRAAEGLSNESMRAGGIYIYVKSDAFISLGYQMPSRKLFTNTFVLNVITC